MSRNEEILEKLLEEIRKKRVFPAYIGKEPAALKCTATGPYFRISGETGKNFPPEALKATGATEAEIFAAFEWVSKGSHEHYGIVQEKFFVFIPEDKRNWPKD